MVSLKSLKNPQKIIHALATNPMSKWELKEETKLEYPRVHEAVALLGNNGYVKVFDEMTSQKGIPMKIYGLTFRGVMAYLASLSLEAPPQIYEPDESVEAFKERYAKEKERYMKEIEQLARFLECYGKLLDYPVFTEIRWLAERFTLHIYRDILDVAELTEAFPPFPAGASQLIKAFEEKKQALKKRKWRMVKYQELKKKTISAITQNGKTEEVEHDPFAEVNEAIKQTEKQLETLLAKENEWWQREFAKRFFERIVHLGSKEKTYNEALHRFAKELLKKEKELELDVLEKALALFKS
jgi:uncharacterized protein YukE